MKDVPGADPVIVYAKFSVAPLSLDVPKLVDSPHLDTESRCAKQDLRSTEWEESRLLKERRTAATPSIQRKRTPKATLLGRLGRQARAN